MYLKNWHSSYSVHITLQKAHLAFMSVGIACAQSAVRSFYNISYFNYRERSHKTNGFLLPQTWYYYYFFSYLLIGAITLTKPQIHTHTVDLVYAVRFVAFLWVNHLNRLSFLCRVIILYTHTHTHIRCGWWCRGRYVEIETDLHIPYT